jgi:hypothetical protein
VVDVRRDEFDYLASDAFVELLAARELTLAPRPE